MNKKHTGIFKKSAAALQYNIHEDKAPRLVAKGSGKIAERIIEVARDADIPLFEDPNLISLLMKLDINEFIPAEMYVAIAEVLAFIYNLNKKAEEIQG